jgi:hypothetical protein
MYAPPQVDGFTTLDTKVDRHKNFPYCDGHKNPYFRSPSYIKYDDLYAHTDCNWRRYKNYSQIVFAEAHPEDTAVSAIRSPPSTASRKTKTPATHIQHPPSDTESLAFRE